ncbi:MAG TPA: YoaK family protein [Acidimicrobiia bacterium]|nr:YoaK family protein [Acidimicrobiia bacterium]
MGALLRFRVAFLAATGGFVDAVTFIILFGLFTAHLTGDTTRLGVDLGTRTFNGDAGARVAVIIAFVVAVAVGSTVLLFTDKLHVRRRALLGVQAVLLVVFMVAGTFWLDRGAVAEGSLVLIVLGSMAAFAMGLQNVVVRNVAGISVATTFMTGMLTAMAEDIASWVRARHDPEPRRRAFLHGGIWLSYITGGIVGAAAVTAWELRALCLPIAVIIVAAITERGGHGRVGQELL